MTDPTPATSIVEAMTAHVDGAMAALADASPGPYPAELVRACLAAAYAQGRLDECRAEMRRRGFLSEEAA